LIIIINVVKKFNFQNLEFRREKMAFKPKMIDPKKAKSYFQDKMAFTTGPIELERWIKEGENINIVDVRRVEDYSEGHIPGSVNLQQDQWKTEKGLRKDKINVLYCYSQVCHLAATAAIELTEKGYPIMELEGGFRSWKEHGLDVEKVLMI
jgi:rhodanese-related sulfurtransferase